MLTGVWDRRGRGTCLDTCHATGRCTPGLHKPSIDDRFSMGLPVGATDARQYNRIKPSTMSPVVVANAITQTEPGTGAVFLHFGRLPLPAL